MIKISQIIFVFSFFFLPRLASAHCPLCTAGAGALAIFSSWLGVSTASVGVFLGAFALALGLWLARLMPRQYFPYQNQFITLLTVLLTIVPIMPLILEYRPLYISWFGEYGTLFHNTYLINLFVLGSVVGMGAFLLAPKLSQFLTRMRNGKIFPYQGLIITFSLLLITALIFQFSL